jgi:uncharacterized membrane protein YedE/YeeE
MKNQAERDGWNPYLAGALTGLLAIASVWVTTKWLGKSSYLGASTTFVRAAGLIEKAVAPDYVESEPYFQKTSPKFDWQFLLVAGIFAGALLASLTDRSFKAESVPPIWKERFGRSVVKRAAAAVGGGIVAMIGARLADGCPSGHGLSGVMQLSISGIVAMVLFFGTGVLCARLIYRKGGTA